jgi:RNA polymerase sigma-70 factor, ECF subfamily
MSDDGDLLDRWRAGDMKAGQRLFLRYYDRVERFFINKISAGVADLVQETFLACLEGRDRLRDTSKFRAYLFSVAHNVLNAYLRKRYARGAEIDVLEDSVQDFSPDPFDVITDHEEERLLLLALRHIPIHYQVILELHYWEKLPTAEISDILDLPVGTVKSRMIRGRELLKQALTRLAESPDLLQSTISNLDDWVEKIRRLLGDIFLTPDATEDAGEPGDATEEADEPEDDTD